jgi:catechol 2,3-dioxygenase-like lactoylglutathione lyase family enzyme
MRRMWGVGLLVIAACASVPPVAGELKLDHVSLHVADVAVSVRFYVEVLGLREIPAAIPGKHWIGLSDGTAIHLTGDHAVPVVDDDIVHFAMSCADLAPIMARLQAHGVTWTGEDDKPGTISTARTDGVRQIYLRDPDGYWIRGQRRGPAAPVS